MRRILTCSLLALSLVLVLVPTSALAEPAPDAYAQADEPGESPGNVVVPTPAAPADAVTPAPAAEPEVVPPMEEPKDVAEALKDVGVMIEAARNGNWVLFAGVLILLLIFVLDKMVNLKSLVPKAAVPWIAAGMGILVSIGAQLTTGIPWGQALLQGFCAGTVAVGLWELVFQHALKSKAADEPEKS